MKEAKKSLQVKVHEMQTRNGVMNLESSENAYSHDSAIDSGNWDNEPGDVTYRLTRVVLALPSQYDVSVESGCYVKHSNVSGVAVGDRVIAIDDVIVYDKTIDEIRDSLARNVIKRLQLVKYLSPQKASYSATSSHDELPNPLVAPSIPNSDINERIPRSHLWTGDNAKVRLRVKQQVSICVLIIVIIIIIFISCVQIDGLLLYLIKIILFADINNCWTTTHFLDHVPVMKHGIELVALLLLSGFCHL